MSQNTLPQLVKSRRFSLVHDIDKLKKIHLKRENDWNKLENRIKDKHSSIKVNQDTSFMKDMWAFREYGQELTRSIQDTLGFKMRRKHTITKVLLQRYESKFNNPYSFCTPKHRKKVGSMH